jgi:hypothetical protein
MACHCTTSLFCGTVFLIFLLPFFIPDEYNNLLPSPFRSKFSNASDIALSSSKIWSALKPHPIPQSPNSWSAEDGKFLSTNKLLSRNKRYSLTLSNQGEFRIHRLFRDSKNSPELIWCTNNHLQWPGDYWGEVSADGGFSSLYKELDDEANFHSFSSTSFPDCRVEVPNDRTPLILLTDEGALEIHHILEHEETGRVGESGQRICTLFEGDPDASKDMGRLAVILTGNLRSFNDTCQSTHQKILDAWPRKDSVDFLIATKDAQVYGYGDSESTIPWDTVKKDLYTCFGSNLKAVEITNHTGATFPSPSTQGGHCNATDEIIPLDRQINIFHAHFLGYQLLLRYMIKNSLSYKYVLKLRPDHIIWGDAIPKFHPLPSNQIVFIPPYFDMPVWASTHLNHSQLVATDQAAWGPLLPMSNWLSIYPSFVDVVKSGARYGPCYGPEVPCNDDTHAKMYPCFVEGLSGYWPTLHGVNFRIDWRWKIDILREGGTRAQVWRAPWNRTQGTRLVESGWD